MYYGISNFKSFNGFHELPIKPITLLYGQNSAGKTSVLQSLLMLKQSNDGDGDDFSGVISDGKMVSLGKYGNWVNGHNQENEVGFSFSFEWDDLISTKRSTLSTLNSYVEEFGEEKKCVKLEMIAKRSADGVKIQLFRVYFLDRAG